MFVGTLSVALGAIGLGDAESYAVFKAFRPPLLSIAPDLYNHANLLLEDLGVTAEIRAFTNRPVSRPAAPQPSQAVLADEKALTVILERLLNGQRQHGAPQFVGAL
jgi:hypothetical protein